MRRLLFKWLKVEDLMNKAFREGFAMGGELEYNYTSEGVEVTSVWRSSHEAWANSVSEEYAQTL